MNARQLKEYIGRQLSRREFLRMMAIVSVGVILAACGGQATPTEAPAAPTDVPAAPEPTAVPEVTGPTQGGVLRITINQGLGTLDPHKFTVGVQHNQYPMFWNGLVYWDNNSELVPDLAESIETVSPTQIRFVLRQGVLFHNGREFTAEDVKFSLERVLNPDTGSYWEPFLTSIAEVVVEDDYTVLLNLSAPNTGLLEALADVRMVAMENVDDIATNPIGTGPFMMKEFVADEFYEGERFPDYFREGIHLDGVRVTSYKDTQAAIAAFRAGDADVVWSLPTTFDEELSADPDFELVSQVVPTFQIFAQYDVGQGLFADKRVRQAMRYAVDSDAVKALAYIGRGEPNWTNNMFPSGHWAVNPNLVPYTFDLDKAKELFEEAGVAPGTEIEVPTLDECCPEMTTFMEIQAANLAKIDIHLKLNNYEVAPWVDLFTPSGKEWPDLFSVGGALPAYAPGSMLQHVLNDPANWDGTATVKELLAASESAETEEEQLEALWEIQRMINEEVPVIIPVHNSFSHARRSDVMGLYQDPSGHLKYQEVWLDR